MRRHLTYSNIAATLALIIAVAGGTAAVAGVRIAPKNSVTTKSIRANNVTARDVTGLILAKAQGTFTDAAPPDGVFTAGNAAAPCPGGARLISGGGFVNGAGSTFVTSSTPGGNAWSVGAKGDGSGTATITAFAICLSKSVQAPQRGIP